MGKRKSYTPQELRAMHGFRKIRFMSRVKRSPQRFVPFSAFTVDACARCARLAAYDGVLVPGDIGEDVVRASAEAAGLDEADIAATIEARLGDLESWWSIYRGVSAGSGGWGPAYELQDGGDGIRRWASIALRPSSLAIGLAGHYDKRGWCDDCFAPYCMRCWGDSDEYGVCPMGHGKSLDPHWHPDWDD